MIAACRRRRQVARASCSATRPDFERHVELGFRFIGVGSDLNYVIDGAAAVVAAARKASVPA